MDHWHGDEFERGIMSSFKPKFRIESSHEFLDIWPNPELCIQNCMVTKTCHYQNNLHSVRCTQYTSYCEEPGKWAKHIPLCAWAWNDLAPANGYASGFLMVETRFSVPSLCRSEASLMLSPTTPEGNVPTPSNIMQHVARRKPSSPDCTLLFCPGSAASAPYVSRHVSHRDSVHVHMWVGIDVTILARFYIRFTDAAGARTAPPFQPPCDEKRQANGSFPDVDGWGVGASPSPAVCEGTILPQGGVTVVSLS